MNLKQILIVFSLGISIPFFSAFASQDLYNSGQQPETNTLLVSSSTTTSTFRSFNFTDQGYLRWVFLPTFPGCSENNFGTISLYDITQNSIVATSTNFLNGLGGQDFTNQNIFVNTTDNYTWSIENTNGLGNGNSLCFGTTTTVPFLPSLGIQVVGEKAYATPSYSIQNSYPPDEGNVQGDIVFQGIYSISGADIDATYRAKAYWYPQGTADIHTASATIPYYAENVLLYIPAIEPGFSFQLGIPYDWYLTIEKNGSVVATSTPTVFFISTSSQPIPPVVPEYTSSSLPYNATSSDIAGTCTWSTNPRNWGYCILAAILDVGDALIKPHTVSVDAFKAAFLSGKDVFPFSLFFGFNDIVQRQLLNAPTSTTGMEFPSIQANGTFTTINVFSSSSLTATIGSAAKQLWFDFQKYLSWVLVAWMSVRIMLGMSPIPGRKKK